MQSTGSTFDAFISHASENKAAVVIPIARRLQQQGYRIWVDTAELVVGTSLLDSIFAGLDRSRYGILIVSREFLLKPWPRRELDRLVETGRLDRILPVRHEVEYADLLRHAPVLHDLVSISTERGLKEVCNTLARAMGDPG
jgi:hypothetical protein